MKTNLSSPLYIALFAFYVHGSWIAQAQDIENNKEACRPKDVWKQLDTNQDEQISLDEFNSSPLKNKMDGNLFKKIDVNQDELLSKDEIKEHMIKRREGMKNRMEKLDIDKSGSISLEEFKQGETISKLTDDKAVKMFEKLDRNHDGQPNTEDRSNCDDGVTHLNPEEIFHKLDVDANGTINLEEFSQSKRMSKKNPEKRQKIFNMFDKNQDGQITLEEMKCNRPKK